MSTHNTKIPKLKRVKLKPKIMHDTILEKLPGNFDNKIFTFQTSHNKIF